MLQIAEQRAAFLDQFQGAAGGGDEDFRVAPQQRALHLELLPAGDHADLEAAVTAQLLALLADLPRQFPRGHQHQGTGAGALALLADQALQDGQQESGRLAAAGGGIDEQIAPLQGQGNGLLLHGGGRLEAHLVDGLEQTLVQVKIGKHGGKLG